MLILECSQGCYGRKDGSVTISLRNFVGEGIIKKPGEAFYTTLFGIIISSRLIIHAFSTKTGIERVSG